MPPSLSQAVLPRGRPPPCLPELCHSVDPSRALSSRHAGLPGPVSGALCLQKAAILTTIGVLEEPLGNARLHGARLMAALLNTNTPSINQELCRLNTMGLLLVSGHCLLPPPRGRGQASGPQPWGWACPREALVGPETGPGRPQPE